MATRTKSIPEIRMRKLYNERKSDLAKTLNLKNEHEAPIIRKIIVSVGLGRGKDDKRLFESAINTISKITGQKPVSTVARHSIASFKLRAGQPVGLKVTLRGNRMYEFLDRLVAVVLPRLRDFHGVSTTSFDSKGNYNLGFEDQSIFPELSYEDTAVAHGIQITIAIDTKDPSYSRVLLETLGMPFAKEQK
jgi:large subunit ribosomal protein L5